MPMSWFRLLRTRRRKLKRSLSRVIAGCPLPSGWPARSTSAAPCSSWPLPASSPAMAPISPSAKRASAWPPSGCRAKEARPPEPSRRQVCSMPGALLDSWSKRTQRQRPSPTVGASARPDCGRAARRAAIGPTAQDRPCYTWKAVAPRPGRIASFAGVPLSRFGTARRSLPRGTPARGLLPRSAAGAGTLRATMGIAGRPTHSVDRPLSAERIGDRDRYRGRKSAGRAAGASRAAEVDLRLLRGLVRRLFRLGGVPRLGQAGCAAASDRCSCRNPMGRSPPVCRSGMVPPLRYREVVRPCGFAVMQVALAGPLRKERP